MEGHNTVEKDNKLYTTPNTSIYWTLDVGYKRKLKVKYLQDTDYIEFECCELSPSGKQELKQANKSIRLTLFQLKQIFASLHEITDIIKQIKEGRSDVEFSKHIGDLVMLKVDQGVKAVDCRKHYVKSNMPKKAENVLPGLPGTAFKFIEWEAFERNTKDLYTVTNLSDAVCPSCGPADHNDLVI